MGYASLSYSGIRTEGEITAEDIYRLEKEYAAWVADICKGHGLSRKLLFSHSGGWRGDLDAAVQQATCPLGRSRKSGRFSPVQGFAGFGCSILGIVGMEYRYG